MNNTIFVAEAKCGSGKTEAMIKRICDMERKEKIIVFSPTQALCEETKARIEQAEPRSHVYADTIHSSNLKGYRTVKEALDEVVTLQNTRGWAGRVRRLQNEDININVILACHEALGRFGHKDLEGWIIVIDELIDLHEVDAWRLREVDLKHLYSNTFSVTPDGKLEPKISKADLKQLASRKSPLGTKACEMLKKLIDYPQHLEADRGAKSSNEGMTVTYCRLKEEHKESMVLAKEVHFLAANFFNTLPHLTLKCWGFSFGESHFTPTEPKHSNTARVKIVPLLGEASKYSKSLSNKDYEKSTVWNKMLSRTAEILGDDFIYVVNQDKKKSASTLFDSIKCSNAVELNYDNRGSNEYRHLNKVAFIAKANPRPEIESSLERLAYHTKTTYDDWRNAWDLTYSYEVAYQTTARTSIRELDNKNPVTVVVPDHYFAEYLVQQFPDASVDCHHVINDIDTNKTKSKAGNPLSSAQIKEVERLIGEGLNNTQIHKKTGRSREKVASIRREMET